MAAASVGSERYSPHSPTPLLEVMITEPRSYLAEMTWKKRWASAGPMGRYPISSMTRSEEAVSARRLLADAEVRVSLSIISFKVVK